MGSSFENEVKSRYIEVYGIMEKQYNILGFEILR
jgi:hypothetical protein